MYSNLQIVNSPLCDASLEKSWLDFIKLCIANCRKMADGIQIRISSEGSSYCSTKINEIIPLVILWNPLNFPGIYGQLTCPTCRSLLKHWKWKDGSKDRDAPRKLFCIQERVLLVSSVYLSEKNHQIISHDPQILRKHIQIPFVFFPKSGVTKDLFDFISTSIQTGMTIEDLESMLINLHSSRSYNSLYSRLTLSPTVESNRFITEPLLHKLENDFIGRKLISKVFIRTFLETEHMYTQYMAQKKEVGYDLIIHLK